MKRTLLPLLALGLAAALQADYTAHGDPKDGDQGGGPRYEEGRGPAEDGPEGGPGHEGPGMGGDLAKLKAHLELSDEQVKKLQALKEERQELKALRREIRDKKAKLSDLVEDKASEEQIGAALRDFEAAQVRMKAAQERLKTEREAILTVTQRAKLISGRPEKMGKRGPGMMKGGAQGDGPRKDRKPRPGAERP